MPTSTSFSLFIYLLCMAIRVAAVVTDYITVLYGDGKSTAVRSDGRSGPIFTKVLRFYSLYQFLGACVHYARPSL
eukprot:SAG11_NODE_262_length_11529_cov_12.277603_10_plen_75_part_00